MFGQQIEWGRPTQVMDGTDPLVYSLSRLKKWAGTFEVFEELQAALAIVYFAAIAFGHESSASSAVEHRLLPENLRGVSRPLVFDWCCILFFFF